MGRKRGWERAGWEPVEGGQELVLTQRRDDLGFKVASSLGGP